MSADESFRGWAIAAASMFALTVAPTAGAALNCDADVAVEQLKTAIVERHPDWYQNINVSLRLLAADTQPTARQCDFYRAASGMNGALCIDINPVAGTTSDGIVDPVGSYGDNAVDRLVQLAGNNNSFSCAAAINLLEQAMALPFLPIEIDPRPGQVCVRDVMRRKSATSASAEVRDSNGARSTTSTLLNTGDGCFQIDDPRTPGNYMVERFLVDTSAGDIRNLGVTGSLSVGEPSPPRVWFVDRTAEGDNFGSQAHPYHSIADLNAAQNTIGGPSAGDVIFLSNNGDNRGYQGPVELLNRQVLVGQGTNLLALLRELNIPIPVGLTEANNPPITRQSYITARGPQPGEPGVQIPPRISPVRLARHNSLYGLSLNCFSCTALFANAQGSLTTRDLRLSGAVALGLFNMHLDVEVTHSSAFSRELGPGYWVANTTGRVALLGDPRSVSRTDRHRDSSSSGMIFRNTGEVFIGALYAQTLLVQNAQGFELLGASIAKQNLQSQAEPAILLRDVQGKVKLFDVYMHVFGSAGSAPSYRGLIITNSVGEVAIDAEKILVQGSAGRIRNTRVDRLIEVTASRDARVDFSMRDSDVQSPSFLGVACEASATAKLSCNLEDVSIVGPQSSGPKLAFSTNSGPGGAAELSFKVVGSTLDAEGRSNAKVWGSSKSLISIFGSRVGKLNGIIDNLDLRGLRDANGLYQPSQQAISFLSNAYLDSSLKITNSQFRGFVERPAIGSLSLGTTDITLTNNQFYGEFAGYALDVEFDNSMHPTDTYCLDASDNTIVSWAPRDDAFVRLQHRGTESNGLLLPDYAGSSSGEMLGTEVLSYLQGRGNDLRTFNELVQPSLVANEVNHIRGDAGTCRTPEFRTFVEQF